MYNSTYCINCFLRVQVYPVAGYVDSHAHLKPEGVSWIEQAQCDHKAHGANSVCQLIQYRTEFGALIVIPGRMAVYCVQQRTDHVTPRRNDIVGGHEVEGDQCQNHPAETCWNVQLYFLLFSRLVHKDDLNECYVFV